MKILITGSAGRVGRAIHARLRDDHEVIGLDRRPSPTSDVVATLEDEAALAAAMRGAGAVIHVAALHAPHVGQRPDAEFESINVEGTERVTRLAVAAGVRRMVFTSTTALYGSGGVEKSEWVTEDTVPRPKTIYHRTKLAAERRLEAAADEHGLAVTSLRMSRCFPERAPLMAAYRLHRGVDARDVAEAHALALEWDGPGFRKLIVSGATPFQPEDAEALAQRAPEVLAQRAPALVAAFAARGWDLPENIDRVYDARRAHEVLGWTPRYGFEEVLAELDRGSAEVLPP
jgi:UDP-glucose 4-epimerase